MKKGKEAKQGSLRVITFLFCSVLSSFLPSPSVSVSLVFCLSLWEVNVKGKQEASKDLSGWRLCHPHPLVPSLTSVSHL